MYTLRSAILATMAYADIFDYPLTAVEIHRYLVHLSTPLAAVQHALETDSLLKTYLSTQEGFYTLVGREALITLRQKRQQASERLWSAAYHYGRLIAHLPFVRMVAVTGSLAMNNINHNADIDYFIITANGRVWLCRAMVILMVKAAARQGIRLCPNYFLAERALTIKTQTFYGAHEIAQMVPIAGLDVYQLFRQQNSWTDSYLPNATTMPIHAGQTYNTGSHTFLEATLRTPLGQMLEQWEQRRKIARFSAQNKTSEASFTADWCKGHFDQHFSRIMIVYNQQLERLRQQNIL